MPPRRPWRLLLAALLVGTAPAVHASGWSATGEATYEARDAWASWRGRAPLAAVDVAFDPARPEGLAVTAVLRPADFRSGNVARDANARLTVFEVADHPEAVARVAADPSAGAPTRTEDGARVPVAVDLTLHGVARTYRAVASLVREGADWVGTVAFEVSLEAHGMRRPRLFGLVTEDAVRVEVAVRARPSP